MVAALGLPAISMSPIAAQAATTRMMSHPEIAGGAPSTTNPPLLAALTDPTGLPATAFGASVGLSGNTAVVGAPYSLNNQGIAYIYTKSSRGWRTNPTVVLHDPGNQSVNFGLKVAISGSVIMIGVPQAAASSGTLGAVYVYTKTSKGWPATPSATLTCSSTCGQGFGTAVKISGTAAVIVDGNFAHVYSESRGGWLLRATLVDPLSAQGDGFNSVALSGTTVVLGAAYAPYSASGPGGGTAFIYSEKAGVWPTSPTTILNDPVGPVTGSAGTDDFGYSVAVAGTTVTVGAVGGNGTNIPNGAAFLYTATIGGVWPTSPSVSLLGTYPYGEFGYSMAMSFSATTNITMLFVGAPSLNGVVGVYATSKGIWSTSPSATIGGPLQYGELGASLFHSGTTLIGGAPGGNGGAGAVGHAYIYGV
jgi:hypothetical protein